MSATLARAAKISVVVALAAAWGAVSDDAAISRLAAALHVTRRMPRRAQPPASFTASEIVKAVDGAKGWLTLDHEAIIGFMGAMEMMYRVEPARLTADLRVGDRVAFDIDAGRYVIVGVKVLDRAK